MIIIRCIKNVEKELEVVNNELERELKKVESDYSYILDLQNTKSDLENYLEKYKKNLSELNDIEARIYYKIVYDGLNIMKAIEKVAEENYLNSQKPTDTIHIYKKIFPKVKKLLEI